MKTVFPGMKIIIIMTRRSRGSLIVMMGMPILVKRRLYIENSPLHYFMCFLILRCLAMPCDRWLVESLLILLVHDDVIKWKHFPRYLPFVRGLIPHTEASDAELWCFLWSVPEEMVGQTFETPMIWGATTLIITSLHWMWQAFACHGVVTNSFSSINATSEVDWNMLWNFKSDVFCLHNHLIMTFISNMNKTYQAKKSYIMKFQMNVSLFVWFL